MMFHMQIKTCTSTTLLITKVDSVILSMDEKSGTIISDYLLVFGFPAKRLLSISITISISIPTYTFNLKQQLLLRNKRINNNFSISLEFSSSHLHTSSKLLG